jgi:PAS domain S-box-containing protein
LQISDLLGTADANDFTRELLFNIGQSSPDFIYAKDLNSRMIFANRAVLKTLGKSWAEIRGKSDVEWHSDPDEARAIVAADARIMASGETESLEEVVTSAEGPQIYLSTKSPLRAADGRIIGLYGISMNITVRKHNERLRQLLVEELDHRVRNTLAVVQVIARQTLKTATIEKAVWQAFESRLQAMVQAHGVLTQDSWQGADVRQIVAEVLSVHGQGHVRRFDIEGPAAWVDAHNALSLALALHELGTNALKYGSLSVPSGRVLIRWKADVSATPPVLDLSWQEIGGPPVQPPRRKGFGSKLIEQAFGANGGDSPRIDYDPGGVRFTARLRLGTATPLD